MVYYGATMTECPILYQTTEGLQPLCREDVISGFLPWGRYPRPNAYQRYEIAEIIHSTILQVAGELGVGIIPPIGLVSPAYKNTKRAEVILSVDDPIQATALNFARPYLFDISIDLAKASTRRRGELGLQATTAHEMYHIKTIKKYPNVASGLLDSRSNEFEDVIVEFAALLYGNRFVRRALNGPPGGRDCKKGLLNEIWEVMQNRHPRKCIWMKNAFH